MTRAPHARTLAPTQLAIMAAEAGLPEAFAYTLVSAVRATGVPDWTALIDAIGATMSRHDVFSWQLTLDDAYQVMASGGAGPRFELEDVDLRGLAPPVAEEAIRSRINHERRTNISLLATAAAYTRLIAFRMPGEEPGETAVCALTTHHALADEHATELVWSEIFRRTVGHALHNRYDKRYADWTAAMASPMAAVAAVEAGQEVAARLAGIRLGVLPRPAQPASGTDESSARQIRATIPVGIARAAAARAADLGVPVTAVYLAAIAGILASRASAPHIAMTVPATRRTATADMDVVGCYIGAVPVLAQTARPGETGHEAILDAHDWLRFAARHAHADPGTVRAALERQPQVFLAFESPRRRRTAGPVAWTPVQPPDSPAKHDVTIFLSPGIRGQPGDMRMLWRPGALDEASAGEITAEILSRIGWLAAGG